MSEQWISTLQLTFAIVKSKFGVWSIEDIIGTGLPLPDASLPMYRGDSQEFLTCLELRVADRLQRTGKDQGKKVAGQKSSPVPLGILKK